MNAMLLNRIRLAFAILTVFVGTLATGLPAVAAKSPIDRVLAACDGATTLTTSSPVSADVSSGSDVDVYAITLVGMPNDVTIKVSDPTNELKAQAFGNCDLTRGPGSGEPIDGAWDGNDQVITFTAGAGTYYATVKAKPGSHSYPLYYTISLSVN